MFRNDWSERKWRPEKGKNRIRILPAAKKSKGSWFTIVGKHWVSIPEWRPYFVVCSIKTFKRRCAICEFVKMLETEGNTRSASYFRYVEQDVFNVIVRGEEWRGSRIYEAPMSVGRKILSMVFSDREHRIVDISDAGFDLVITYDPDAKAWAKYKLNRARESSRLGSESDIRLYASQSIDLVPEVLYKLKDDQQELELLDEVKRKIEYAKQLEWERSPEGQAEMDRRQQEEREKQEKEEKERAEAKRHNEESRNKWREMIKDGSAAEEVTKEEVVCLGGEIYTVGEDEAWFYLEELFHGEKDWGELKKILVAQMRKKEKAKPEEKKKEEKKEMSPVGDPNGTRKKIAAIRAKYGLEAEKES